MLHCAVLVTCHPPSYTGRRAGKLLNGDLYPLEQILTEQIVYEVGSTSIRTARASSPKIKPLNIVNKDLYH